MKSCRELHLIIYSVCVLSSFFIQEVRAQQSFMDSYNVSYITMSEGLPHNFVDDIYKDSQGFLWISMGGGGLSRYDGYSFVDFNLDSPQYKLKSNFVHNVVEDSFQRLWVASEGGLDILDLTTLQPSALLDSRSEAHVFSQKSISMVILDAAGCIWMHCNDCLYRIAFTPDGQIRQVNSLQLQSLFKDEIHFEDVDNDGSIWIELDGKLCKVKVNKQGYLQAAPIANCLTFEPDTYLTDFITKENEVWISSNNGLFRYDRNKNIIKVYKHVPDDPHSLSQNYLTSLAVTYDKQLIVSSLKGLNVYNPLKDNFERIEDKYSDSGNSLLNNNFVNCLRTDGKHIWVGTENGGINKLALKRLYMHVYRHDKENRHSISPNPVNAIYEDEDQTLWVGTVEGGLNKKTAGSNSFTHYTHENGSLKHNSVSTISADNEGRLWIGTWGGGITWLDRKNPQRSLGTLPADGKSSPIDFVGALAYDSINNGMWIGANQGIFFYDLKQKTLFTPLPSQTVRGCIGSIIDRDGHLWMGCMNGVYIIDLKSRTGSSFSFRHLEHKLDNPNSNIVEKITCFYETEDGTLWLGSNGYGIYKRETDAQGEELFTAYTTRQGLPSNSVRSILEDSNGYLWIATNNGLSRFSPSEELFVNYTTQDGLNDSQFYWNAACRTAGNELYFGNMTGLIAIEGGHPDIPHDTSAPLRFTSLFVENEEVTAGGGQLPQSIAVTREIRLHERTKSFALEFALLDYDADNTHYSYKLEGFDNKWTEVADNRRYAAYTNLSPGKYTLKVKCSTEDKNEKESIAEMSVVILPYFYRTGWFIALAIACALFVIWQVYQWRIRDLKKQQKLLHLKVEKRTYELSLQKQLLEKQRDELSKQNQTLTQQNEKITRQKTQLAKMTHKIRELTVDKINFFTNITHEFRTPITLIIGPIERALKLSYNPQVIEQLHFVERNSKYLLSLVNQLMDFRKVESGKMEIIKRKGDFLPFLNELITPFVVFAQERNIRIKQRIHIPHSEFCFDEEAMHKILTNLLSNAIKFTPDGGNVYLYAALLKKTGEDTATRLYLCVSDTGSGIPTEDIDKVFNRFYQSKEQVKYPMYGQSGSGIGLYLCQRIVQMMDGTIWARNNPVAGCSMRILIPLSETDKDAAASATSPAIPSPAASPAQTEPSENEKKKNMHTLIVEDNPDMRSFIRSILQDKFEVTEAADGTEALNLLHTNKIDFIISDLMMPNMDGIELARRVKENIATSHIPFLMLTAKTSQETRVESYQVGVDGYLLKPFDETLLMARINNILENRKRNQRQMTADINMETLGIDKKSGDELFSEQLMEVIKANYKNPMFDVSEFCEAMGVSRTLLSTRLQKLLGQSPGQFIRNYRLNLARQIILAQKGKSRNIAEIAYEVGFNDPKYFTRCFIKEFQIKPSELISQLNQEAQSQPSSSDEEQPSPENK